MEFNSPHRTKLSIWFGRMSRKSRSIANRPDFYAVEGYYPASFVQIACGRRCIGRRKSDRLLARRRAMRGRREVVSAGDRVVSGITCGPDGVSSIG